MDRTLFTRKTLALGGLAGDRSTFTAIDVTAGRADDALRIDGGPGNDTPSGGNGRDTLVGGAE